MKITSIPQIYRNVRRWTEIITVLSKYGLADWISGFKLEFVKDALKARDGEAIARHTREARIRLALTELGPTFIKLGQLLSTRPDVVGVQLADELAKLQANVPADPPEKIRALIAEELGLPVEELFAEFVDEPIASASIGQVHAARLVSGEEVAVKVQHLGIESTVREDLDVLGGLAQLAELIPEFAPYRPLATVAEMARTLRRELDFGREERNLLQFEVQFADNPFIRIPKPITELCTPRVLTMERIDGTKLENTQQLIAAGIDLTEVARRGAELYLDMIFTHGFYHADPHPGNIVVLPNNVIGLLDFGMVGRLDERLREDIEEMLLAIVNQDVTILASLIKRVGTIPPGLDEGALSIDIADFVGHYATQSLDQFDLGGALTEMTQLIHRHRISLPPQVGLLIKTLVTLEGTTKMLCPKFSLMEVMRPFQRKMLLRRLSPARQLRKARRVYFELEQLAEIVPRRLGEILEQIQAGKFDVHLDHRGLGPSVNRLVLAMMASSLFLGSSLMLSQQVPPLIFPENNYFGLEKLSILGLGGCFVSILVGLRLLRAIGKSGHLDRRE
ncbi:MAG: AarF/ABC1/UbiB kinase family protein [Planctomycetaceae bacterium]|nr:AarF/ABC1/UbiB kinase family protein [Planctomycetales bacterium]MCB9923941.1 AarF/ABC1/UbiB kinase family protein [Planctomycetaceae bacterium]